MTVVTAVVGGLLVVLLLGFATTYRNWAALRTKRLDQGLEHLAKFEHATLLLVKDESTPEPVVELLGFLAEETGRSRLAIWTAREVLSGKMFERPKVTTERARTLSTALDSLTEEQTHLLAESVAHGLMSSASTHPLIASYLRRAIGFAFFAPNSDRVEDGDKARAIIVDYGLHKAPKNGAARAELVAA